MMVMPIESILFLNDWALFFPVDEDRGFVLKPYKLESADEIHNSLADKDSFNKTLQD